MVGRRGDRERRRFWRESISRQRSSGLSVRAFCRCEGLAEPSFYAWRKRLANEHGSSRAATAFASVRVADESSQPNATSRNPLQARVNCVEIVLVDGVRVRVPPGADRQTLADVLVVLRERATTSANGAGGGQESPAC